MEVLWERGPSTVAEVVNALSQKLGLSYSTVLTTLRILEQKGYLQHTKEGQAFVYHPIIDRNQARKKVLKHVLNRADSAADQPRRKRMSANLDAIASYLRPVAEHLVNGLILSAVIFLGSLLAFRLLFREQRWSASTRH